MMFLGDPDTWRSVRKVGQREAASWSVLKRNRHSLFVERKPKRWCPPKSKLFDPQEYLAVIGVGASAHAVHCTDLDPSIFSNRLDFLIQAVTSDLGSSLDSSIQEQQHSVAIALGSTSGIALQI